VADDTTSAGPPPAGRDPERSTNGVSSPGAIADVVFDTPVDHAFSYRIPHGWSLAPGQRVLAPLRGGARLGMVVGLRPGADETLKPIAAVADPAPLLGSEQLALAGWIAAESLTSLGSTIAALTPAIRREAARRGRRAAPPRTADPHAAAAGAAPVRDPVPGRPISPERAPDAGSTIPELLVGAGRERRALERVAAASAPVLVLVADLEACARWAQRLEKIAPTVRLDSGVPEAERIRGWRDLARGAARLAVGTRSALLAPLPAGGTIVVVDEHETTHRPPGHPGIHARDVALERAGRQGLGAVFTAATPSVEMWRRAACGTVALRAAPPAIWPAVALADTRGILRREALTPLLAREIREALAAGRRAFLAVSRLASALACDECGGVVRCDACGIALAYARAAATLVCRLCSAARPLPDVCPECRGHRLSPFGWGIERVEHAVRRRFPKVRVARYDPAATRGARAEAQRAAAAAADVVIGTRGALRLFGPASLGLVGFVSPDQLLRLPDFRAGEHTFAFLWAAAERVRPDGRLVIQSQNPSHYVFTALLGQDLAGFYERELEFRRELGYPPFRRLAVVAVRARTGDESRQIAAEVAAGLRGATGLTVYPLSTVGARGRSCQIVVKGDGDLPARLGAALEASPASAPRARGIMDVEVDPVTWPS
jgi:primosomal protein N' (replication factor Y)